MNLISIFRRLFLPLVVLLLAATAGAQSAYDEIKADIDKAGGVYFMYPFDTPSATPAPKGYEPFYISHYGRHGARYILSNDQYDNVAEVLRRARADGKLTARGIDACDRFLAIYPHLKGRAGRKDRCSTGGWPGGCMPPIPKFSAVIRASRPIRRSCPAAS